MGRLEPMGKLVLGGNWCRWGVLCRWGNLADLTFVPRIGRLLNESMGNPVNAEVIHKLHLLECKRSTLVSKASVEHESVLRWAHEYE